VSAVVALPSLVARPQRVSAVVEKQKLVVAPAGHRTTPAGHRTMATEAATRRPDTPTTPSVRCTGTMVCSCTDLFHTITRPTPFTAQKS